MFQYAAAYALALKLGVDLEMDPTGLETNRLRPYQLSAFCIRANFADVRHNTNLGSRLWRGLGSTSPKYGNFAQPFDPKYFSLPDGTSITGWFQSWRYVAPAEEEIRTQFVLQSRLSANAAAIADKIRQTPQSISLHVRRGDYLSPETSATYGILGRDYYERGMRLIRALLETDPHYFLFSDDPVWVRENLAELGTHTVVEGQDAAPWEDMALMSQCRHHIIANSTFSWWGAWLNPRPDKWVIAPRQWFTAETLREKNICDLLPPEWIAV